MKNANSRSSYTRTTLLRKQPYHDPATNEAPSPFDVAADDFLPDTTASDAHPDPDADTSRVTDGMAEKIVDPAILAAVGLDGDASPLSNGTPTSSSSSSPVPSHSGTAQPPAVVIARRRSRDERLNGRRSDQANEEDERESELVGAELGAAIQNIKGRGARRSLSTGMSPESTTAGEEHMRPEGVGERGVMPEDKRKRRGKSEAERLIEAAHFLRKGVDVDFEANGEEDEVAVVEEVRESRGTKLSVNTRGQSQQQHLEQKARVTVTYSRGLRQRPRVNYLDDYGEDSGSTRSRRNKAPGSRPTSSASAVTGASRRVPPQRGKVGDDIDDPDFQTPSAMRNQARLARRNSVESFMKRNERGGRGQSGHAPSDFSTRRTTRSSSASKHPLEEDEEEEEEEEEEEDEERSVEGRKLRDRRGRDRVYEEDAEVKSEENHDEHDDHDEDPDAVGRRRSRRLVSKSTMERHKATEAAHGRGGARQPQNEGPLVSDSEEEGEEDEESPDSDSLGSPTYVPQTSYGLRTRPRINYNNNSFGQSRPAAKDEKLMLSHKRPRMSRDASEMTIDGDGEEGAEGDGVEAGEEQEKREYNLRKKRRINYYLIPPMPSPRSQRRHNGRQRDGPNGYDRGRDKLHGNGGNGARRPTDYHALGRSGGHGRSGRGFGLDGNMYRGNDLTDNEDMVPPTPFKRRMGSEPSIRLLPMNLKEIEENRANRMPGTAGALGPIIPRGSDPIVQNVTFEQVGGLDNHIRSLKEMIILPLLYPEVYSRFQITPPRGVLFYGPPGTGKTLLARALASSCSTDTQKVAFFMRKGADLLSKWVGEAERQLRLLFEEARAWQPSIIFFDEIDGLVPSRSSKSDPGQDHASIVSTLLALMDGLDSRGQVIVIGATNRIDAIDPALRRPGRFDREFYFPLPNETARRTIIDIATKEWKPPLQDNFKGRLAVITKGYSGADIKALCTEAALRAIQRRYPQIYESKDKLLIDPGTIKIKEKDFLHSAKKLVPSSQRSTGPIAVPLPKILEPLLSNKFFQIVAQLEVLLPDRRKKNPADDDDDSDDDDEIAEQAGAEIDSMAVDNSRTDKDVMSVMGLQDMHTFRPRLLIAGSPGMGQRYMGPAILDYLEGYHVQSFDLATLMADSSRTSEAVCIQLFVEVKRRKPSVIYIPNLNTWYHAVSEVLKSTFVDLLNDLNPHDPILLLATSESTYDELPGQVRRWFSSGMLGSVHIKAPEQEQRQAFFADLAREVIRQPTSYPGQTAEKMKKKQLEVLPLAPLPPPRELTEEEKRQISEHDDHVLREFRRDLRSITMDYQKNKWYKAFAKSVEPEENTERTEPYSRPMDLQIILQKVNDHQYLSLEEYIDDIRLIKMHAEIVHGKDTDVAAKAHGLVDEVESLAVYLNPDLIAELKITGPRRRAEIEAVSKKKGKEREKVHSQLHREGPVGERMSYRLRGISPSPTPNLEQVEGHHHHRNANKITGNDTQENEGILVATEVLDTAAKVNDDNGEGSGVGNEHRDREISSAVGVVSSAAEETSPIPLETQLSVEVTTIAGASGVIQLPNGVDSGSVGGSHLVNEIPRGDPGTSAGGGADPRNAQSSLSSMQSSLSTIKHEPMSFSSDFITASMRSNAMDLDMLLLHTPTEMSQDLIPTPVPILFVDQAALADFMNQLVNSTGGWSVEDLDHLKAALLLAVVKHRDEWDKTALMQDLHDVLRRQIEPRQAAIDSMEF